MRFRSQSAVISVILLASCTTSMAAPTQDLEEISRIPLDHLGLTSVRSAVFLEDQSTLVIVDEIGGRAGALELTQPGAVASKRLPSWRELSPTEINPSLMVKASSNGYVQIVLGKKTGSPEQIHWFGRDLSPRGVTSLLAPKSLRGDVRGSGEDAIVGLYSWTVSGARVFAYGALDSGRPPGAAQPYKLGFFTYRLRTPGSKAAAPQAHLVETFGEFHYYTLGLPFIVSRGHEVFYLEMGYHPSLYFYDMQESGKPVYLAELPGSDQVLAPINSLSPTHELFADIEDLKMPVGLYVDDESRLLYLLSRSPSANGTRWTMTKLRPDPANQRVKSLGSVSLPTSASHLTVTFTPESVLVIEKSSVRPGREQDVEELLVVPKAWITDPATSPLRQK